MHKPLAIATAMLCLTAFSLPAWAFCAAGDPQACAHPFANDSGSLNLGGNATQQGFDPQTGDQWSSASHKMGDFNFYTGMSSGNTWGGRDRFMSNGLNAPNFNNFPDQTNSTRCAFFETC